MIRTVSPKLTLGCLLREEFVKAFPVGTIAALFEIHVEDSLPLFLIHFAPRNRGVALFDHCHVVCIGGKGEVRERRLATLLLPTILALDGAGTAPIDWHHIKLFICIIRGQIYCGKIAAMLGSHKCVYGERILCSRNHSFWTRSRLHF